MLRKIQSHLFRSVWFRCLKTMGTEAMCRSQDFVESGNLLLRFFCCLCPTQVWPYWQRFCDPCRRWSGKTSTGSATSQSDIPGFWSQERWLFFDIKHGYIGSDTVTLYDTRYCNMTVCNQWLGRPKFPGSLFDHPSQERCRQDLEGAYLISVEYHLIRPASTSDDRQVGNMLFACSGPPADTANFVWELRHFPYSRSWLSLWDFAFCLLQMEFIEKNVKLNELRTGIPMTTKAEKVRSCLRWKVRHSCHPQFYSWKCAKHWAFQNFRTI